MKKSIYLLLSMVFTINAYCQTFYEKALIEDQWSSIQGWDIDRINRDLNTYHYGFMKDDTIYVLSYKANDGIDWKNILEVKNWHRDLVLYRWNRENNKWIVASDIVQTDYHFASPQINFGTAISSSVNNYQHIFYIGYPEKGHEFGKVLQLKNGYVLMLLYNIYGITENGKTNHLHDFSGGVNKCKICNKTTDEIYITDSDRFHFCSVIFLTPSSKGMFTATRFEPTNKTTSTPELYGAYCKENLSRNDSEIVLDFSDDKGYSGTLNFAIYDGKVQYINGILKRSWTDENGKNQNFMKNYELILKK